MSSPPPPNPTATSAAAIFSNPPAQQQPAKPLSSAALAAFPLPTQRQQQTLYSNSRIHHPQSSPGGILYPVASSGRGFLSKHQQSPTSDQNAATTAGAANSGGFSPHPVSAYPLSIHRPYAFSNSGVPAQNLHQLVRPSPSHLQQNVLDRSTGVSVSANPKVVAQPPAADDNGFKDPRDKTEDDAFVIIRDRKVQVSEGMSLYAQCRSWLKNGITTENQPQYADCARSLPKPLPASMVEVKKDDDKGKEEEDESEDVENLSEKELLQQHVKRAKKVRARLRNKRLQRIERYKDRLALLLPPVVDPPQKNDPVS